MQRPITDPSSTLSAAKSVVVPALVVVGHGSGPTLLEGEPRLGAVERLDLALLVNRQHHGVGRRVNIEPDDISQLGGEAWIARAFEGAQPVRLQFV